METFKLWLEEDPVIPRFKRLAFAKVEVPVADVLKKGIHPWQNTSIPASLQVCFLDRLNARDVMIEELCEMEYCGEIVGAGDRYHYASELSCFQETLNHIRKEVCFVDRLTYMELLALAKEQLRKNWSRTVVWRLLSRARPGFDEMRTFLKSKDKNIKITSYAEIEGLPLADILRLEDFEDADSILINEGIPTTNFRQASFLSKVTDEEGRLKLTDEIRDMQIAVRVEPQEWSASLCYSCKRDGDSLRFIPKLTHEKALRARALRYAARWRTDQGRYCFTTDIARLQEMIEQERCEIRFPTLNYAKGSVSLTSDGDIHPVSVTIFAVGAIIRSHASGEDIRNVLRRNGVSMTGRKDELLDKLACMSAELYRKEEHTLDNFFRRHRFMRIAADISGKEDRRTFPVLPEHPERNMLLSMYIVRHLRGSAILESKHVNDTYDLQTLARALIKSEVMLHGGFMRIE